MISKIINSKLFKSSAIYTVSSVLNSAIPFLMLPLLTRYLSPSDYGNLTMLNVAISFVIPFIGLSVHGSIYRKYYDLDIDEFKVYLFNLFIILLISFGTVIGFLFIFSDFIKSFVHLTFSLVNWIYIVSAVSFMTFLNQLVLTIWQLQERPIRYGIFQVSRTVFYTILVLIFIIYYRYSWEWIIISTFVSSLIFSLVGMLYLLKEKMITISFNISYIKSALNFGIPMLPNALRSTILSLTDRLFLVNMFGYVAVGMYAISFQLSMIIGLLVASFNSAFSPWLFKRLKENNPKTMLNIVRYTYLCFILLMIFGLLWIFISNLIIYYILDRQYSSATEFIPWIVFSFVFGGMHTMVVNYIYYAQKTMLYGIVSALILLLNIILNYALINLNGSIGVAQATCLTSFLMFSFTWLLSAKVHPMPWLKSSKRK